MPAPVTKIPADTLAAQASLFNGTWRPALHNATHQPPLPTEPLDGGSDPCNSPTANEFQL